MAQMTFGILSVKIRYTFTRNGITYYQRSVPGDLISRYGAKTIKERLASTTLGGMAKEVEDKNRQYEAIWSRLRDDPAASSETLKAHAEALLKDWGLSPKEKGRLNDPMSVEIFGDHLDDLRYRHLEKAYGFDGDPAEYKSVDGAEYLSPVQIEASRLLNESPKATIKTALKFYLEKHEKGSDAKFQKLPRLAVDQFISAIGGDKPFEEVSRADVRRWMDSSAAKGQSKNTIIRRLAALRAIFSMYIREHELEIPNRFEQHTIPAEAKGAKKRETFATENLKSIQKACREADDDLRWIVAMLSDSCSRLAEIVGLRLSDIVLDAPIPHIRIVEHDARSLKTGKGKSSSSDAGFAERDVPLVGVALWAAQQVRASVTKDQIYAFPRYINDGKCNANSASATLNKWLRGQGAEHTTHEFRHTMNDRLRDVGCPEDVRKQIGGWSRKDMSERYGKGYTLERTKEWLNKVVL